MKVLKLNLVICPLLAIFVKYGSSDELEDKGNETYFLRKHYCSSQDPNQCLTVFRGNFSFTRAQEICQSLQGVQINLKNQSIRDFISSVLGESDDGHNLVVNAKRALYIRSIVDLKGALVFHEGKGSALALKASVFKWYPSPQSWDSSYKALCEYKNCTGRNTCYLASAIDYNWFEARKLCLRFEADLMTDVEKAKTINFPKPTSEYWLGASRFYWSWIFIKDGETASSRLSKTPEWSEPFHEDQTTECASVRIAKCGNKTCLKWQAHQCDTSADLSVVCKFNDSLALHVSMTNDKQGILLVIIVATALVLLTFIAIVSYLAMKSRIRKTNKQRNSTGRYLVVNIEGQNNDQPMNNLNYPTLDLPDRGEVTYETIDGGPEALYVNSNVDHIYKNVANESTSRSLYCLGKGFYSLQTTIDNDQSELSNPRSPAVVVDNEVYEGRKSKSIKSLVKLKLFKKSGKKSVDSDTSGSASTYEPLSPTSFGRRIGNSESASPTCEVACSSEEHLQPSNDYTVLSNDPKK